MVEEYYDVLLPFGIPRSAGNTVGVTGKTSRKIKKLCVVRKIEYSAPNIVIRNSHRLSS